jgi:hypothetical protein
MGFWKLVGGGLVLYAVVQGVPSAQMEAKEPGSSVPYREANAEGVHAGMESASVAAQDALTQLGPLMASLTQQVQTGLSSLAPMVPAQPTDQTLPTPVSP